MILTITKVSQEFTKDGAEYRKVSGVTDDGKETTKMVFNNLKFAWPLLDDENVVGKQLEFKMVQKGTFWNVINLKPADEPWPEQTDMVKPEEVATKEPKPEPPKKEIAPQELGMWYKEVGEMYRAGKLEGPTGKALMVAYWARMFTVIGVEKPE